MPTLESKLIKLKQLVTMVNEGITKTEFLASFQAILTQILALEQGLLKKIDTTLSEKSQEAVSKLRNLLDEAEKDSEILGEKLKDTIEKISILKIDGKSTMEDMKTEMTKVVKNMISMHEKRMKAMDEKMMEMHDGKDADEQKIISEVLAQIPKPKDGEDGKDIDPTLIEEIKEDMKNLEQRLIDSMNKIPRGKLGMRKVPIIQAIDLTSQVDGVVTTFTLPRDTVKVLFVSSTQYPVIFNSNDFSLSGHTLSLGSGIGVIESGQSLMAIIETLFYA